jgi:hypothetical protein
MQLRWSGFFLVSHNGCCRSVICETFDIFLVHILLDVWWDVVCRALKGLSWVMQQNVHCRWGISRSLDLGKQVDVDLIEVLKYDSVYLVQQHNFRVLLVDAKQSLYLLHLSIFNLDPFRYQHFKHLLTFDDFNNLLSQLWCFHRLSCDYLCWK